jgi:hypothetical protein
MKNETSIIAWAEGLVFAAILGIGAWLYCLS